MIWLLALYFSPLGLLAFFEVYALGRRRALVWLKAVGVCGLPSDFLCAAVWLRWLDPEGRTVTAKAEAGALEALAAVRAGGLPTLRQAAALLLALYLNARDPGHCNLTRKDAP